MIYSVLNAAQSALLLAIVNRLRGEDAAGVFGFAFSVALLFMFVGNYGIRNFQVSDVKGVYAPGQYYAARIFSILLMGIGSVIYLAVCGYEAEKTGVIAALLIWRAGECAEDVFHGRYQQTGKLYVAGIQGSVRLLVADAVFAAMLLSGLGVSAASFGMALSSALIVLVFSVLTLPKYGGFSPEFKGGVWGKLLAETFPLFLNYFLITYLANVSKYAMEHFSSDAEQARFNMLFTPVLVVNLLSTMVFRPLITEMADRIGKGRIDQYRGLVRRQEGVILLIGTLVLLGVYFLGLPVLSIFYGSDLSEYRIPLLLLMAGGIFSAFSSFYNVCIVTLRGQKQVLFLTGVAAAAAYLLHYKLTVFLLSRSGIASRMQALLCPAKGNGTSDGGGAFIPAVAIAFLLSMLLQALAYAVLHAHLVSGEEGAG